MAGFNPDVAQVFLYRREGVKDAAEFYRNPRVKLELKNYGQSPAFLHRYAIGLSWDEHAPRKFTPYPFEDKVIHAGGIYEFEQITSFC